MSDVKVEHQLGDIVYMKLDGTKPAMVTGLTFRPGFVKYLVTWPNAAETSHYGIELTTVKSFKEVE
jgi:hypothetical protein